MKTEFYKTMNRVEIYNKYKRLFAKLLKYNYIFRIYFES